MSEGQIDSEFLLYVRRFLEVIMLRRVKDSPSIGIDIPPKREILLFAPLSSLQKQIYRQILTGIDQSSSEGACFGSKRYGIEESNRGHRIKRILETSEDDSEESSSTISSSSEKPFASAKVSKSVIRNVLMELRKASVI